MADHDQLSRRERQIMAVIYADGSSATVTEVLRKIPDPPGRTAVRTLLRILEGKGHLKHQKRGREFVYRPTRPKQRVGRSALRRVLQTFYEGSLERAVVAHLADPNAKLSQEELDRIALIIAQARKRER